MEAESVDALPKGEAWVYEPKWDGFRCLALKSNGEIFLRSKSGKPLNRYFPDVVTHLETIKAKEFLLDGELVIGTDSGFSFSDLQLRLHPAASRVTRLAKEQPATYILFDILLTAKGKDLTKSGFGPRRAELEKFYAAAVMDQSYLTLSPQTDSLKGAEKWLKLMRGQIDGLMAKNMGDIYQPGERIMQKFKPVKTADCVIGGFRYGTNSKLVGSLLLGLYDDQGLLNHVGFTSGIDNKAELTKQLEKLIAKPGFTGKAPGGPSRWSTERTGEWQPLKPKLVVEVSYDHVSDDRFRHGTKLLRFRPDKAPGRCKMEQLYQ